MSQTNSNWTDARVNLSTLQSNNEDQLYELGQNLSENPTNVLAYKRVKKNRLRTFEQSEPTLEPVYTLNEFSISSNHQITEVSNQAKTQQMFRKFVSREPKPVIKPSITKRVFSGEQEVSNSLEKVKKRISKSVHSHNQQKPPKKGDKYLMVWLNKILAGYFLGNPVEEGRLKALEKFNLDKNSLLSKGLNEGTIEKIYQTLFAHSMGFNNQLKELVSNMSTLKLIWKVYAILLEYCSQGHFQTMIGELQRDMRKNEQRLLGEIEKRQKMIDNADERMDQKFLKYEKQNKELSNEIANVNEKYNQIESDFREMEMAFNMEVNLRLSYQNIVNRVYSTHQKLNLAHTKLFNDFRETDAINKKISTESAQMKSRNIQLSVYYQEAMEEVENLKKSIQNKEATIFGLKLNEQQMEEKLAEESQKKKDQLSDHRERERKVYQLEQSLKSSNTIIEIMKGSSNSQLEQYKRVAEENLYLRNLKQEQTQKIGNLLTEVNCLNGRQNSIRSELQYANKKIEKLAAQLAQTKEQVAGMINKVDDAEVQKKSAEFEMKQMARIVESLRNGLREGKERFEQLEKDSKANERYARSLREQFDKIHDEKLEYELRIKALENEKFQAQLDLNRSLSEIATLKKALDSSQALNQQKYDKLYTIWGSQSNNVDELSVQLAKTKDELDNAKTQIAKLTELYSNLTFQKSKIENNYQSNLLIHEMEKKAQRDLMIQISKYQQNISGLQREVTSQEKAHKKDLKRFEIERQKYAKIIKQQKELISSKQGYVHPMMLEDGLAHTIRAQESEKRAKLSSQLELEKIKDQALAIEVGLRKQEADTKLHCKEVEKQLEKRVNQAQKQEQYYKYKCKQLRTQNYQLEMRLQYSQQVRAASDSKIENKMNELIKQKNDQIQQLLTELEALQDNIQKKRYMYETQIQSAKNESKEKIEDLTARIEELEKQLAQRAVKLTIFEEQYQEQMDELDKEKDAEGRALSPKRFMARVAEGERPTRKTEVLPKRTDFMNKLKHATLHYRK